MLTIILTILFWCLKPCKKGLGIAAIIFSALGTIADYHFLGLWCLIDVALLIANIYKFYKEFYKNN